VIGLEPVLRYRFTTRGPLGPTDGSPRGTRQYWEMTSGTLTGDGLHAEIAMPGSDWMEQSPDGFWRPDVRVALQSDDGALILMRYAGLVEQTDAFVEAASHDRPTGWDDQYMRFAVTFDTGAERYRWLNQSLFLARGHILGTGKLEYEIYRVT
jgi:Protein of unknown function (DUF3237)